MSPHLASRGWLPWVAALLILLPACASRDTRPATPAAGRPAQPAALLARAQAEIDAQQFSEALRNLDAVLATPASGPTRAVALELMAFLRLAPALGAPDLPAAKALLVQRRQLPASRTRQLELDAVLILIELVSDVRGELLNLQASLDQLTTERGSEQELHAQRTAQAARVQRQLRQQVESLKAEVERLEAAVKGVTASLVGRKPGGR
jgi:hypothetical protein